MEIYKYKLNLYTHNGLLKPEISRATFSEMTRKYGEVIKSISAINWQSEEDIIKSYLNVAKRLRLHPIKTDIEIKSAIKDLYQSGILTRKPS